MAVPYCCCFNIRETEMTNSSDGRHNMDDNIENSNAEGTRGRSRGRGAPNITKFRGKCEALAGYYVYDVNSSDSTESFQKTTGEIAEYVAKNTTKLENIVSA